jgi:hypothetical protein
MTTVCRHGSLQRQCLICEATDHLDEIYALVAEQAEDEGLWFVAHTAPEAYLQAALRRLHAKIEGKP